MPLSLLSLRVTYIIEYSSKPAPSEAQEAGFDYVMSILKKNTALPGCPGNAVMLSFMCKPAFFSRGSRISRGELHLSFSQPRRSWRRDLFPPR